MDRHESSGFGSDLIVRRLGQLHEDLRCWNRAQQLHEVKGLRSIASRVLFTESDAQDLFVPSLTDLSLDDRDGLT